MNEAAAGSERIFHNGANVHRAHLGVEQMRVHHRSLDVVEVGVVLQRSLQQTGLLAQLGDVGSVIVGEHLVPQDRICYLQNQKNQKNNPHKSKIGERANERFYSPECEY